MMTKDSEAQGVLKDFKSGMTWAELEAHTHMTRGYLSRVIKGTRPASNRLRIALGLHPLHVTVDPCPTCGTVTVAEVCPVCNPPKPKRVRKPEDGVVRFARVDAARIAALSALYTSRRVAWKRCDMELTRTLDGMTG